MLQPSMFLITRTILFHTLSDLEARHGVELAIQEMNQQTPYWNRYNLFYTPLFMQL